jgi:Rrf2 family protein
MSSRSRLLGHVGMRVSAKVDYAVRAVLELVGTSRESPRTLREVADAQAIPPAYLADILSQLGSAGVIGSQRGADGGYWLARPAEEVDLGSVIRAVGGSPVEVRGQAPDEVEYVGSAVALQQVWIALRNMLEFVTVADVIAGEFPQAMLALTRGTNAGPSRYQAGEHAGLG